MKSRHFGTILSQYVSVFITLIATVLVLAAIKSSLGDQNLGIYLYLQSMLNLFGLGVSWLNGPMLFSLTQAIYAEDKVSSNKFHSFLFSTYFIYILFISLFLMVFSNLDFLPKEIDSNIFSDALPLYVLGLIFLYLSSSQIISMVASIRNLEANILRAVPSFILILGLVTLGKNLKHLSSVYWLSFLGNFFAFVIGLTFVKKRGFFLVKLSLDDIKSVFKMILAKNSISYFGLGVLQLAMPFLEQTVILRSKLGLSGMANFYLFLKILEFGCLLLTKLVELSSPYFARSSMSGGLGKDLSSKISLILSVTINLIFLGSISFYLLGNEVVQLWIGSDTQYIDKVSMFCLSVYFVFLAFSKVALIFSTAIADVDLVLRGLFFESTVKLLLLAIFGTSLSFLGFSIILVSSGLLGFFLFYRRNLLSVFQLLEIDSRFFNQGMAKLLLLLLFCFFIDLQSLYTSLIVLSAYSSFLIFPLKKSIRTFFVGSGKAV
jgi:O-antigen/teichoic acid export membrane protein